ncbi:hypothetical protein NIES2135_65610 (plasmid) [Leptolyngbya boryana NIES-2135]|uniref:Uncharacterized protein n=1 Tax=Leptolyngbya boryana NIES-2135 TaxID=1973484 RepID=A0A1Z4JSJ9_LEPBY|nr:hypothetical protein NIES2135_65610 [Leptolyngbya boryana NIES-2135]
MIAVNVAHGIVSLYSRKSVFTFDPMLTQLPIFLFLLLSQRLLFWLLVPDFDVVVLIL